MRSTGWAARSRCAYCARNRSASSGLRRASAERSTDPAAYSARLPCPPSGNQFLWQETNLRTDRYGGTAIRDRATFPAEVLQEVRQARGPDFTLSIRISQWKEADYEAKIAHSPAELGQLVSSLRSSGADLFHVSTRRFWTPEWAGSDTGLAGWVKSFTDAPVIAVGSVGLDIDVMSTLTGTEARPAGASRIADLVRRFQRGDSDLVSVGRSLIGDPDWVAKMRDGRSADIRPFRRADLEFLSA